MNRTTVFILMVVGVILSACSSVMLDTNGYYTRDTRPKPVKCTQTDKFQIKCKTVERVR